MCSLLLFCLHDLLVSFRATHDAGSWSAATTRQSCIHMHFKIASEPVFVNLLRSPGIHSQPTGPVRQPYLSYRPARLQRLPESIPRNRFLGSINVYKYGLSPPMKCVIVMYTVHIYRTTFKVLSCFNSLKVHKNENFFGFDFEFCTFSLLVMSKY